VSDTAKYVKSVKVEDKYAGTLGELFVELRMKFDDRASYCANFTARFNFFRKIV